MMKAKLVNWTCAQRCLCTKPREAVKQHVPNATCKQGVTARPLESTASECHGSEGKYGSLLKGVSVPLDSKRTVCIKGSFFFPRSESSFHEAFVAWQHVAVFTGVLRTSQASLYLHSETSFY